MPGASATSGAAYSVIELYLNGSGTGVGNLSLAAEVVLDEGAGTVSLANGSAAVSLPEGVKHEPGAA